MSLVSTLDRRFQPVVSELLATLDYNRVPWKLTSARRSRSWQKKQYEACQRRARTKNPCPYPVAKPGTSLHEKGLAFDLWVPPEYLPAVGALWESWGLTWGGRFRDPIHFDARPRR